MRSNKLKIFSISILAILVIAGLYFLTSLLITVNNGSRESSERFDSLCINLEKVLDKTSFLSEKYFLDTKTIINNDGYVSAITFQIDSTVFFAYPTTSSLFKVDNIGNPYISTSSPIVKSFTKSIITPEGNSIIVNAAIKTILPEQIFNIARNTFIIVLACTLIVLIVIVYFSFFKPSKDEDEKDALLNDKKLHNFDEIEGIESISSDDINLEIIEEQEPIENLLNVCSFNVNPLCTLSW